MVNTGKVFMHCFAFCFWHAYASVYSLCMASYRPATIHSIRMVISRRMSSIWINEALLKCHSNLNYINYTEWIRRINHDKLTYSLWLTIFIAYQPSHWSIMMCTFDECPSQHPSIFLLFFSRREWNLYAFASAKAGKHKIRFFEWWWKLLFTLNFPQSV